MKSKSYEDYIEGKWLKQFKKLSQVLKASGGKPLRNKDFVKIGLDSWVTMQRNQLKQGKLSEVRIARLREVGFQFDPRHKRWEDNFNQLLAYKERVGNPNIPYCSKDHYALSVWLYNNKRHIASRSPEQLERLRALGVDL